PAERLREELHLPPRQQAHVHAFEVGPQLVVAEHVLVEDVDGGADRVASAESFEQRLLLPGVRLGHGQFSSMRGASGAPFMVKRSSISAVDAAIAASLDSTSRRPSSSL